MNAPSPRLEADDLRAQRRRRLFDAMTAHDLDVLVLGRPAEVAFATGARQLWTAGSRPFGPACVAVRSTGHTHLLSVSDYDVPVEVGHDDLYGLSWNPVNVAASLAAIPGLSSARRVGTTSSSPGFPRLLASVAPDAEVVDGGPAMWSARMPKEAAEIERIRAASSLAEGSLRAMQAGLKPGVSERDLLGIHLDHLASQGSPTTPTEGVVCATAASGPVTLRRLATSTPIEAGQLVVLDPGAFCFGYEGGIGRTVCAGDEPPAGAASLAERSRDALGAVVAACRPGATGSDLLDAWTSCGEDVPQWPLAVGVGLGMELPVFGGAVGLDTPLIADTVLAVSSWVTEEGTGGWYERDLVVVRASGPEILTAADRAVGGGASR